MTTYYLDTSALIKRYVAETGSRWIVNLVSSTPGLLLFTSRLTVKVCPPIILAGTPDSPLWLE